MSTESKTEDFTNWFQETFGADFPVEQAEPLVHLRDQIWASRPADVAEVPMTSNCQRPEGDHTLAGFWGHSANSYAFYLIARSGNHQCFFRLHYGGAYGDPEEDALRVIFFLQGYQAFLERWRARLAASDLHHEMGKGRASVTLEDGNTVTLDDPPGADPGGFWQRLEAAIGR